MTSPPIPPLPPFRPRVNENSYDFFAPLRDVVFLSKPTLPPPPPIDWAKTPIDFCPDVVTLPICSAVTLAALPAEPVSPPMVILLV